MSVPSVLVLLTAGLTPLKLAWKKLQVMSVTGILEVPAHRVESHGSPLPFL